MKFSLGPTLFGPRKFDFYADIEQRLATLETDAAMRGVQSYETANAGPVTIPDSTSYVNILSIPSTELTIPRDDSFVVLTYQMDIAISGAANPIRGLLGRLNGSLWGGVTFTESATANFAAKTFYSRPDYADLFASAALPAWAYPLSYRIPMVFVPGASGPYPLTLDVRRDLTGWGGTVTVTNVIASVDVL